MKRHLMLLLTLSALLNYQPGRAQAHTARSGELVASARTKPVSTRVTPEATSSKSTKTTVKKDVKTTPKVAQKPIGHFWSRIMSICSEVHTASKKKS